MDNVRTIPLDELFDDMIAAGQDLLRVDLARRLGKNTLHGYPLSIVIKSCTDQIAMIKAEIRRRVELVDDLILTELLADPADKNKP